MKNVFKTIIESYQNDSVDDFYNFVRTNIKNVATCLLDERCLDSKQTVRILNHLCSMNDYYTIRGDKELEQLIARGVIELHNKGIINIDEHPEVREILSFKTQELIDRLLKTK